MAMSAQLCPSPFHPHLGAPVAIFIRKAVAIQQGKLGAFGDGFHKIIERIGRIGNFDKLLFG